MKTLYDVPFSHYTTLKAGGVVGTLYLPESPEEFGEVVTAHPDVPILGGGSNTLLLASGTHALIVTRELRHWEDNGTIALVDAGVALPPLASALTKRGYGGFAALAGIPGTVGGALMMNAGCFGTTISDRLLWVECLEHGTLVRREKATLTFAYRQSSLAHPVVRAAFDITLQRDDMAIYQEKLGLKKATQPYTEPTLGSNFKNGETYSSAKLLDECGLKGKSIGAMKVSEVHANFIVNSAPHHANPDEYRELSDVMAAAVNERFQIPLSREVRFLGQNGWE